MDAGKWNPPGVGVQLEPPPPRCHEGNRWRPPRANPEVPQEKSERTKRAVTEQCLNSRVPGYSGFIPSARAEDVCARTQASMGRIALSEQMKRRDMQRALSETSRSGTSDEANVTRRTLGFEGARMPDDHPLGRSRSDIVRNHWVPTIPGYGGFIPGKESENICGGGTAASCRMAGRAIAERQKMPEPAPAITIEDNMDRSRIVSYYQDVQHGQNGLTPDRARLVDHLQDHCSGKIPGYTGFIPRVHGESIYGARASEVNKIASTMCEDRVLNPHDHGTRCCAPQFPAPRKLRM